MVAMKTQAPIYTFTLDTLERAVERWVVMSCAAHPGDAADIAAMGRGVLCMMTSVAAVEGKLFVGGTAPAVTPRRADTPA